METHSEKRPIVVGVDAEPESLVALRWAAEEAAAMSAPMVLVHAFEWLPQARLGRDDDYYFPSRDDDLVNGAREQYAQNARDLLREATTVVGQIDAGIVVSTKVVDGTAYEVLREEGRGAVLLVLGSHSRGLLGRMLLGSVSSAIGADPPAPVAIIRAHTRAITTHATDMPVVVGFDGSATSRAALAFAADHAAARHSELVVVHSYRPVDQRTAGSIEEQTKRRTAWLREYTQPLEKEHPALTVVYAVTEDRPAQALVEWSTTARLVVVGTGGRPARTGSVGQALLHHSWSPVVVIPET